MSLLVKSPGKAHPRRCTSVALISCLLLGSCLLAAEFGLSRPLLAQASNRTDHTPAGWLLTGSNPADYRTGVDQERKYDGRPSAYLTSAVTNTEGFGTLMQSIDSATFAGKTYSLAGVCRIARCEQMGRDVDESR